MSSSSTTPFPTQPDEYDEDHYFFRPIVNRPKNHFDFNSRIMLTAIISLSLVILLLIALHIYVRFVLRRRARLEVAALNQFGLITIAATNSSQPPKTGLDPSVIASLPSFIFKQSDGGHHVISSGTTVECAVCLSCLENEELVRLLPNCKHTFHADCIDKWLTSHSTCPICRTEAQPRLQPEPREVLAGGAPSSSLVELGNYSLVLHPDHASTEGQSSLKINESTSRLSSFRRILSRERSSRRLPSICGQDDGIEDLERQ